MTSVREWFVGFALALVAIAALIGCGYMWAESDNAKVLAELASKVEAQNKQAQEKLDVLTAQRDEKQRQLNEQAAQQETKDADAKAKIASLDAELRARPIRVRYVSAPAPAGGSSGSAAGQTASAAVDHAGSEATATGLLPEQNSERLRAALTEVELLSAAYNSLYNRYVAPQPNESPPGH